MDQQHLILILILYSFGVAISVSMVIHPRQSNLDTKENDTESTIESTQNLRNETIENQSFYINGTIVDDAAVMNNSTDSGSLDEYYKRDLNSSSETTVQNLSTELSIQQNDTNVIGTFTRSISPCSTTSQNLGKKILNCVLTIFSNKEQTSNKKTFNKTKMSAFTTASSIDIQSQSFQLTKIQSKAKPIITTPNQEEIKSTTKSNILFQKKSSTQKYLENILDNLFISIIFIDSDKKIPKSDDIISTTQSLISSRTSSLLSTTKLSTLSSETKKSQPTSQTSLTTTKLSISSSKTKYPQVSLSFKSLTTESNPERYVNKNKDLSKYESEMKNSLIFKQKSAIDINKDQIKKRTTRPFVRHISTEIQLTTIPAPWKTRKGNYNENSFHKVCNLSKNVGQGSDSSSRWYFNAANGKCEWFNYFGYGGNGNRFYSRANCENSCIEKLSNLCSRTDIVNCAETWLQCSMESDLECEQNALEEKLDVELTCPPKQPICINHPEQIRKSPVYLSHQHLIPNDCKLPSDQGHCKTDSESSLVFFYSEKLNDCFAFLFSKCGGNLNRFYSKADCMNRCAI